MLDFNSFTALGEKTEVSYYHAFPNSQNFGQASTEMFIGASGLKGKVYGGYGATVPTGSLGQQGYNGTTTVFGGSLSYPVIRSRQQTLNVNLVFDALDSDIWISRRALRARRRAMMRCASCASVRTTRCRTSGSAPIARRSTRCRCACRKA